MPNAGWLAGVGELRAAIVRRAMADVGICEMPPGSNRSPYIDECNRLAGVPVGSYWCASWAGRVFREAGAQVPSGYASCDAWVAWAKKNGRWTNRPVPGAAVLYGKPTDASHIGIVVRTDPRLFTCEGNTGTEEHSRNGYVVWPKEISGDDELRVLGYVMPLPTNGASQ